MCCVHCPHICLPWTRRSLQAFYYVGSIVGYIEHNLAIVPSSLCVYANKLAACLWGESFHHLPRAWYPWKAMSMLTLLRVINVYVWVLKRPAYITMKTKKKKKTTTIYWNKHFFSVLALLAVVASPRSWLSLSCCTSPRSWCVLAVVFRGRKLRFVKEEVAVKFVFIGYKQHNTIHNTIVYLGFVCWAGPSHGEGRDASLHE